MKSEERGAALLELQAMTKPVLPVDKRPKHEELVTLRIEFEKVTAELELCGAEKVEWTGETQFTFIVDGSKVKQGILAALPALGYRLTSSHDDKNYNTFWTIDKIV